MNKQLNALIGKCFELNRMLDRGMSLLMVRWGMTKTSELMHELIAHAYPGDLFADSISDYQGSRNAETIYPATPVGDRGYEQIVDFFEDYVAENSELEDMIKDCIDTSVEEGDYSTKVFLEDLLYRLLPYTAISHSLLHMIKLCDNDKFKLQMLDAEIKKYIIL